MLFSTLAQADELLLTLRAGQQSVVPAAVAATAPSSPLAPAPSETSPGSPVPAAPRARSGLSAASVPKILLGLGAACLLVAALVFLAVTWSVMGVAGRTATLVGFTVVTGLLAGWLAHRALRAAAESLTLVALGLLAFDLFGAQDSGWLGDITSASFFVLLGAVLAVAGGGAGLAVRRTPTGKLTGAEVVTSLGIAAICVGLVDSDRLASSAALTVAVLFAATAAFTAHRLRLTVSAVGAAIVCGGVWLILVANSLERAFDNPTARELWLELEVWPLVTAAVMAGAVALVRSFPTASRVAGAAIAELILAFVALIPFSQGTGTRLTIAVLFVLAAAAALTWFTRVPWSRGCAVSTALGGVWMVAVAGQLASAAFARMADAGGYLWDGSPSGRLPAAYGWTFAGWLLPIAVLAVVGAAIVVPRALPDLDRLIRPLSRRLADPTLGGGLVAATVIGTVALYSVPVLLVAALMLATAALLAGWALTSRSGLALSVAAVFLSGGLAVSLYDEWLTALALLVALVIGSVVHLRWPQPDVSAGAGFLTASALAASIWTWGTIADVERTWAAFTVLVVLSALVLAVPPMTTRLRPVDARAGGGLAGSTFIGVESGAAVSMFSFGLAGVAAAPYGQDATWTAVYLTVVGAAVTTMSLLRVDRRQLGWVGGLLLAMASWVRLWDIGVETPEAYTVPVALALGLVGLVHLRRTPTASTMTALAPALGLGLVPSLLWVLWEPATLRSALLGVACLVLLVAGVQMRWTAPVVFAGTVGALVVLRHAAPFVDQAVPRWVLIAAAGTLLIGMGITWERRIQEARTALGYVRSLR